jgi:hypothetical protein
MLFLTIELGGHNSRIGDRDGLPHRKRMPARAFTVRMSPESR